MKVNCHNTSVYVIIFILITYCMACEKNKRGIIPFNTSLSIEDNIAQNSMSLDSINDLKFLDDISKSRSVIFLGEGSHSELTTSCIKINMLNHLRKSGFNSIALESVPFLTAYVFSNPEYAQITKYWKLEEFWAPVWSTQKTCKPLIDMVNRREIKIWGIDVYLSKYDIFAAKAIIQKYSEKAYSEINWNALHRLYDKKFFYYNDTSAKDYEKGIHFSVEDQCELMRIIDTLSNYVQLIIANNGNLNDLKALIQWIRIINTSFSDIEYSKDLMSADEQLRIRNRDYLMAENILWVTENYPTEKFSLWCANFHVTKDISQTTYPKDSLWYFVFQSAGETVFDKLRDKMYSLAFTSLDSQGKGQRDTSLLEAAIGRKTNDASFAFVNFEKLRFEDGYFNKEFDACMIGKKSGKWLYIFDGVYYIKDQEYR